jgi:hypothetical protein
MGEHLEEEIVAFVGIDEVQLSRTRLVSSRSSPPWTGTM